MRGMLDEGQSIECVSKRSVSDMYGVPSRGFALQDQYRVNLISMLSWSFEFEDESFEGFRTLATNGGQASHQCLSHGGPDVRPGWAPAVPDKFHWPIASKRVQQSPDIDAFDEGT
jgi:hypothetical protein